jgi:short chain dehydrogenase
MPSNRNGSRNAAKSAGKAHSKNAEPRPSHFTPGAYFRDRTVLITGASSGIGRDLALTFAKMGAKVAMMARRKSLLETLAGEITAAGGEALPLAADVTRRADVRDAVDRTLAHFNRIDVLINSAGIAISDRVETMPPEDLERMMSVNLMGTLHTMQAVLPSMRAAGAGSIVNIASLAGRRGMPPLGAYQTGESHAEYTPIGHSTSLASRLRLISSCMRFARGEGTESPSAGWSEQRRSGGAHDIRHWPIRGRSRSVKDCANWSRGILRSRPSGWRESRVRASRSMSTKSPGLGRCGRACSVRSDVDLPNS